MDLIKELELLRAEALENMRDAEKYLFMLDGNMACLYTAEDAKKLVEETRATYQKIKKIIYEQSLIAK